ncbi:MAG: ATP phosphoribosyltransferase [Dehalococcoidales bacterium]|nr:ATP phosphoribosyltransferase [Dehalococcoidales bacterium]
MQIRIALPKGRLLDDTAKLNSITGWNLQDYSEGSRLYHLSSTILSDLSGKILHEKDIPIQVAIGNYDLGICGLDWIQELLVKYPGSNLVKVADLGYGELSIFLAASRFSRFSSLESIRTCEKVIDIASEYPNLAESLALGCSIRRFNIFPLWGAAEIYPPENADLVLLSARSGEDIPASLIPVTRVLDSTACLVANRTSLENKDLSGILRSIYVNYKPASPSVFPQPLSPESRPEPPPAFMPADSVRLALPDGHQQKHMVAILSKAGINIRDYPSVNANRRPTADIPGLTVKVIRPQDMPLQIANGKFDIAVTGRDWVMEHLYQFPSSPLVELADLKYGWVKIVAAVHNDLPVNDIAGIRKIIAEKSGRIRVASEYVRIADKYARDNHLGMYRIIPTWGATEAFLPDDADILIENTETGGTLKRHNLKIIDTLFESTACLIANAGSLSSEKAGIIRNIAERLQTAVKEK